MTDTDTDRPGAGAADAGQPNVATDGGASELAVRRTLWQRLRWLLVRAAALLGAFLLFALLLTGGAGWYTSRPQFCRSCHIMEPYFASWQESTHKDVSCIKCHFAPGFAEKVRGKMLGLVQLAKYVTQSEGPRPAAEVPDASCLRSGCHETRTLAGRVEFHGMAFDHKPHMEKLRRGKRLRCTSCHSQIVQGSHMTVTTSTCFLCHFKEGLFNQGLGACTHCHQIPEGDFDLGGGVIFNHNLAYERGVDCAFCHSDLIRGDGSVPVERCGVCHNREDDLKRREDHAFIHKMHVTEHKVDCLDCHLEIQHSLDREELAHAASDCALCHPDHHREQVSMLQGVGGKTVPRENSSMVVARVACRACHRMKQVTATGTVLWKASTLTCSECHDDATIERVRSYQEEMATALSDLRAHVAKVRTAVEAGQAAKPASADLTARLDDFEDDLEFLSVANGIHNVHYATSLTQAVLEQLTSLCVELKLDPPRVTVPELMP